MPRKFYVYWSNLSQILAGIAQLVRASVLSEGFLWVQVPLSALCVSVSELVKEAVLKTVGRNRLVGSNPTANVKPCSHNGIGADC